MIRCFGLGDFHLVKQLQTRGVAFDLRRLLLHQHTPLWSALVGYLTHEQLGTINYIHHACLQVPINGIVSVFPRRHLPYWDLAFLAPALDSQVEAMSIWTRLLTHLTVLGAQRGITRIYARTTEDAETEDTLHQMGFAVVTREEIFVLVNLPSPVVAPHGLHKRQDQDSLALNNLYREVVPALVQQAEGVVPHWAASRSHSINLFWATKEYVWSEKSKANAYIGLCEKEKSYWLEVMVRPEFRAEILPLIKHVLSLTDCSAAKPVYCQVPDYSVGMGWVLRTLGFESYARQVMLVEHTMVRVPTKQLVLVPGLEASVEIGTPVRPVFRIQEKVQEKTTELMYN
ncbi:MAG: hypothetical protein ACYCZF_11895 [Anaerolineae bacterium]